jgi:hypothetical protein
MKNLVDQLNALKHALDTEAALRAATETEFNQGIQNGPMRQAHDASIQNCLIYAQALLVQSQS